MIQNETRSAWIGPRGRSVNYSCARPQASLQRTPKYFHSVTATIAVQYVSFRLILRDYIKNNFCFTLFFTTNR